MGCNIVLRPVSYTITAGASIVFTVPDTALANLSVYTFYNCTHITEDTGAEVVSLSIGGTSYPVLDRAGNALRYGRMRPGMRIRMVYGDDPVEDAHFLVIHDMPCECLTSSIGGTA